MTTSGQLAVSTSMVFAVLRSAVAYAPARAPLARRALSMGAASPPRVHVVSYNVLSSRLSAPDYFTRCAPADLDPPTRLARVLAKLEAEAVARRSVICLQEVSAEWAGELHSYFASRGYHLATGLYGRPFNGYMGVALAWPTERFAAESVEVARVADTKPWPRALSRSLGLHRGPSQRLRQALRL